MKKIILAVIIILWAASAMAAGTYTAPVLEKVAYEGKTKARIITTTLTDDTNGTTVPISMATYGLGAHYLYSVETNPGSTAPTDNYDLVVNDAEGIDIAGGLLANRDQTASELVCLINSALNYPIVTGDLSVVMSGNSVNGATVFLRLVFLPIP